MVNRDWTFLAMRGPIASGDQLLTFRPPPSVARPGGHDDRPLGERRADHVAGVLRACGREEQGLRLGGEIDVARMKQHVADALSEGRPTWLACEHDVTPASSEGVG